MSGKVNVETVSNALIEYSQKHIFQGSISIEANDRLADTGIDSHNLLDMIMFIEREFGIAIPDTELTAQNLESIERMAACAVRISNP